MAVDPERLADYLGIVVDTRCEEAALAATSWVEKRRSNTPTATLWQEPDVAYGGMLYGALLYQARVTPSGFAGYEEQYQPTTEALYRARDLVGSDPVVA